jgi:preprotein translocase subunit SecF
VLALYVLCDRGLNWGLDFTGGTTIEVGFQQSVSLDKMHEALDQQKIDGATLQFFGSSRDVLVRMAPQEGVKVEQQGNEVLAAAKLVDEAPCSSVSSSSVPPWVTSWPPTVPWPCWPPSSVS